MANTDLFTNNNDDTVNVTIEEDEVIVVEISEGLPGAPGRDGQDGRPGTDGIVGRDGRDGDKGDPGEVIVFPHIQNIASNVWYIEHPLNHRPVVTIFDNNNEEVFADISYPAPNLVVVEFGFEMTGMVQLV